MQEINLCIFLYYQRNDQQEQEMDNRNKIIDMENKTWIEKLLLFIPKSKYNVVKLWDEEYKCNIININVI